jgi:hypothetical protein
MLEEILINSFNGSQSFIIIVSRFFLTFSVAVVGAYAREYYSMLNQEKKCNVDIRKIVISACVPSLLSITFFDGIVKIVNIGALLLFSFISGFLGLDILHDIKKLGVRGMIGVTKQVLSALNPTKEDSMMHKGILLFNTIVTGITTLKSSNGEKKNKKKK